MPKQEVFFAQVTGNRHIEVLKVYDRNFAREAFLHMDEAAQAYLWRSLGIHESYDAVDVPSPGDAASEDFLWEELLEAAREDGNLLSFFVVSEAKGAVPEALYVSPDWPSAEAFAALSRQRVRDVVTRRGAMQIKAVKPDLHGEPHHIHLAASGAPAFDVPVRFADEASKVFEAYREKFGFGASEMNARCGNIYDSRNRLVGRISYNGRIWDADGNVIK